MQKINVKKKSKLNPKVSLKRTCCDQEFTLGVQRWFHIRKLSNGSLYQHIDTSLDIETITTKFNALY